MEIRVHLCALIYPSFFFFSSRRRHTRSVSAFLLNRSSDLICLWKPSISTLSQSPMLGFHKQMDNRIKLLEEILSFRMQGVEFDNGDMYVDGHKAASDVRDRSEERRVGKECRSGWSREH